MKWAKRLLLAVVFLIVFAGAVALIGWRMFRGVPDWYAPNNRSVQEREAAYARADRQLQRVVHDAQEAQHRQALLATQPSGSAAADNQPIQISLTDDELNSFFQKWDQSFGWSAQYGKYLSDPQLVIHDGRLILAANIREMGTVMSIQFEPRLEDGKLVMPVAQVMAGRLPLPESFWGKYKQRLSERVREELADWQRGARIGADGSADSDAVAAGMSELLLDLLNDRPADAVLFLPYDIRRLKSGLPVRLTDIRIEGQTLMLTVTPLNPAERQQLLEHIRTFPGDAMQ
jgi:hypothetical protein